MSLTHVSLLIAGLGLLFGSGVLISIIRLGVLYGRLDQKVRQMEIELTEIRKGEHMEAVRSSLSALELGRLTNVRCIETLSTRLSQIEKRLAEMGTDIAWIVKMMRTNGGAK